MKTQTRLFLVASAAAVLLRPAVVHAGPTVAADLDLGTSTQRTAPFPAQEGGPAFVPGTLYIAGFTIRAGWRFDIPADIFLLPELGGGYLVERYTAAGYTGNPDGHVAHLVAGGRAGWSGPLAPDLRIEPAIFGHGGLGWYDSTRNGTAFDVGFSLDLRIQRRFLVGAQVGYNVVTVWHPAGSAAASGPCVTIVTGRYCPPAAAAPAQADPWIGYGIHAGYAFW